MHHPDVCRSLMPKKAYVEDIRALIFMPQHTRVSMIVQQVLCADPNGVHHRDHGQALQHITARTSHTIENCNKSMKTDAKLLVTALDDITAMTGALTRIPHVHRATPHLYSRGGARISALQIGRAHV